MSSINLIPVIISIILVCFGVYFLMKDVKQNGFDEDGNMIQKDDFFLGIGFIVLAAMVLILNLIIRNFYV